VPPLMPQRISPDDAFGLISRAACYDKLAKARNEGLFTPPSTEGTVIYPFTGGGVNWGGVAFDPTTQILYANTSRLVHIVTLMPAANVAAFKSTGREDHGPQRGAPFGVTRVVAMSPLGQPCNKPPWGVMVAVDLKAGKILWQSTVGTTEDLAPLGLPLPWGTPLVNGVLVTAGGLVFTGAADAYLRAFDAKTGTELWQGRLPVPGVANPMTYEWQGAQYVVISTGGHGEAGTSIGDGVVAFRLARADEAPSLWSRTIDRPGGRFIAGAALTVVGLAALATALWRWRRARRRARAA
jgi:quinoprotein glucose dehydrogenase